MAYTMHGPGRLIASLQEIWVRNLAMQMLRTHPFGRCTVVPLLVVVVVAVVVPVLDVLSVN